jgi:hypothetical protein
LKGTAQSGGDGSRPEQYAGYIKPERSRDTWVHQPFFSVEGAGKGPHIQTDIIYFKTYRRGYAVVKYAVPFYTNMVNKVIAVVPIKLYKPLNIDKRLKCFSVRPQSFGTFGIKVQISGASLYPQIHSAKKSGKKHKQDYQ